MSWQLIWKHWWKLYPSWYIRKDDTYEDTYPTLEIYKVFFFFGPFQANWWTCRPPLLRSKKYIQEIRKVLLNELTSITSPK